MLQNEITKQENAVEEYFCKPFSKLQKHEMDKETTGFLITLLMSKDKQKELPEKEKPFLMKLIEQRIKGCFSFDIKDTRLILFITIIAKSAGTAVMYLTYLQWCCKQKGYKEIDLEKFCELFPMGFPNETDLQKVWDGQKVERDNGKGSDNLLDYQSAMVSIHFMQPAV